MELVCGETYSRHIVGRNPQKIYYSTCMWGIKIISDRDIARVKRVCVYIYILINNTHPGYQRDKLLV